MPTPTKRQEHTPTPWQIARTHPDPETRANVIEIRGAGDDSVLEIALVYVAPDGSQRHANAEFIVRSVNSHAQLVATLTKIAEHEIDGPLDEWAESVAYSELKNLAGRALAQAKL